MHWSILDGWSWQITFLDLSVLWKVIVGNKVLKKMQVVPVIVDDFKWKIVYTSSEKHGEPSEICEESMHLN